MYKKENKKNGVCKYGGRKIKKSKKNIKFQKSTLNTHLNFCNRLLYTKKM